MKRLLLLILLIPTLAWGSFGYSTVGDTSNLTVTHTSAIDSAWVVFYLNTVAVDSVRCDPVAGSSHKTCRDSTLALTVPGTYFTRIYMFASDALLDSLFGIWHNEPGWADIADVWRNQDTVNVDSSDIGLWIANQAGAGSDSTLISNILHRVVWGTAVGSGSDSSTAAQRDIGVLANDIIGSDGNLR